MIVLSENDKTVIRVLAENCVDRDGEWVFENEEALYAAITKLINAAYKEGRTAARK